MKDMLEKEIQKQIMDYLWLVGAVPVRVNSGSVASEYKGKKRFMRMNSEPGCSDILACYRGRFLAIEVKRPKTTTTAKQKEFLDKIDRANGTAFIARSVDDVVRLIESLNTEKP